MKASNLDALRSLFNPRAVAVIGVSEDRVKRGRQVISNVISGGFAGGIYGVARNLKEADGAPCFPSVTELPEGIDVAFLCVSADQTARTLRQCAERGIKVAIVAASGFAENADPAGLARQTELERAANDTGIRIVGPNCNGIYNARRSLALGFNAAHAARLPTGRIAILSHSGALFASMAAYLMKLGAGISIFVSSGNEVDFGLLDYLDYALDDEETQTIALLLDSIADGQRLRCQGERASALGKRIVALKVGTSEAGERAALAHSSRLAGNAGAYAALFEAAGVATASTLEGLMTTAALLSFYGRATGGLGLFTNSGAGAAMLADLASARDITLPDFVDDTRRRLDGYRSFSRFGNPIDIGVFERGQGGSLSSILASDPGLGAVMAVMNPLNPDAGSPGVMEGLAQAQQSSGKPFVVVAPGGYPPQMHARYEALGLHCFPDTAMTLEAMNALLAKPNAIANQRQTEFRIRPAAADSDHLMALRRPLTEPESLRLLETFGLSTVATVTCSSLEAAIHAAENLGWPIVAKAVIEGVAHKTEAGLVRLDIRDRDALAKAYRDFNAPPKLAVQRFVKGDAEAIAGITRARDVGPILLAGLGGIYAEALREVTMWALPTGREEIEQKLALSALGRLLTSSRWRHGGTRDAFIDALLALQEFSLWAAERVAAVDVNPLLLCADGAIAVDALVIPTAVGETTNSSHSYSAENFNKAKPVLRSSKK